MSFLFLDWQMRVSSNWWSESLDYKRQFQCSACSATVRKRGGKLPNSCTALSHDKVFAGFERQKFVYLFWVVSQLWIKFFYIFCHKQFKVKNGNEMLNEWMAQMRGTGDGSGVVYSSSNSWPECASTKKSAAVLLYKPVALWKTHSDVKTRRTCAEDSVITSAIRTDWRPRGNCPITNARSRVYMTHKASLAECRSSTKWK